MSNSKNKTIFGTTEKSNFILNMKDQTIDRLPIVCAKVLIVLLLIGQAVPEVIEWGLKLMGKGQGYGYGFFNTPYICLAIVWVLSIIAVVIMCARDRFNKSKQIVPVVMISLLAVWILISTINSISPLDSFSGTYGRTTGFLTIVSCAFIYLVMTFLNNELNVRTILRTMVIASMVQCVWGLVQSLSQYFDAEVSFYENLNSVSLYNICLPSGFSGSPIFYAEYLCLMLGITLTLSSLEKSKLYTVMSMIYVFLMLDTHTVVGVLGAISIVLVTTIVWIVSKSEGKNFLPIVLVIVVAVAKVVFCVVSVGRYKFYDGCIMWQDSFYRIGSTGYFQTTSAGFNINDVSEVFAYLWKFAIYYIKAFLFMGVGADCLIYTQSSVSEDAISYAVNSFDVVYNDYLQIAVTMGIPTLILYIVLYVFCITKAIKRFNDSNIFKALTVTLIGYAIMVVFGYTSITVMPYLWLLMGIACSQSLGSSK